VYATPFFAASRARTVTFLRFFASFSSWAFFFLFVDGLLAYLMALSMADGFLWLAAGFLWMADAAGFLWMAGGFFTKCLLLVD
jgi:hypothetical protein